MYIPPGWELIWLSQQFHWVFHTFFLFFRHESRHAFAMAMAKISWPFFPATFGVRFTGCAGATSVRLQISGQRAFDCSVDIMFSQASSRIAHPAWGGVTEFSTRCHISFVLFGGFHSYGESPIAGCLKKWKIRKLHGWVRATTILENLHMNKPFIYLYLYTLNSPMVCYIPPVITHQLYLFYYM